MQRKKKLLEALPFDTWVDLLSLLSPMDLLTFEKTCGDARTILKESAVWLTHLKSMGVDKSPNFPTFHPIHSLTTAELRKIVLQTEHAYRTWTCDNVVRHISERMVPMAQLISNSSFVMPVSGKAYVVVYSSEVRLTCIDVETGCRVWEGRPVSFVPQRHCPTELFVATHMQAPGSFLVCICTSTDVQRLSCIEVLRIDLDTGSSTMILSHALSESTSYWKFNACRLCSGVAVAVGSARLLIVDLRSGNTKEFDAIDTILSVQVSEIFVFVVRIDTRERAYLSVVPLAALWTTEHGTESVPALQTMDNMALRIPLSSTLPLEGDIKMSFYLSDNLDERGKSETTISIVSCICLDEIYEAQLHFSAWRISIKASDSAGPPVLVSHEATSGDFDVDSRPLYLSIRMSNLTRSGRFVVLTQDSWGSQRLYSSSISRIKSGDVRLIPIEIPCGGDIMNVNRIIFDEYSEEIYWTCFSYSGCILTRY